MKLKALFRYYGGKSKLVNTIIPLIPKHEVYVEPFFGAGSVFFAKELSNVNVVNDMNNRLITLYKIIQMRHTELEDMLNCTLYSDFEYHKARDIYQGKVESDELAMAWAVFICFAQGFGGTPDRAWGCSTTMNQVNAFRGVVKRGFKNYKNKLENSLISCRDAIRVLKYWDRPHTFFYLDPPYIDTDLGHYNGYTKEHYIKMLDFLSKMQGKFILSSYKNEIAEEYVKKFNWNIDYIPIRSFAGNNRKKDVDPKLRTEILVYNFNVNKGLFSEFI